jgi:hypothetical protein
MTGRRKGSAKQRTSSSKKAESCSRTRVADDNADSLLDEAEALFLSTREKSRQVEAEPNRDGAMDVLSI